MSVTVVRFDEGVSILLCLGMFTVVCERLNAEGELVRNELLSSPP